MHTFRYIEVEEAPENIEPIHNIGDLVQVATYSDWERYNFSSVGGMGLIAGIRFFIRESFDPAESLRYVVEYKVNWIGSEEFSYLDESMLRRVK